MINRTTHRSPSEFTGRNREPFRFFGIEKLAAISPLTYLPYLTLMILVLNSFDAVYSDGPVLLLAFLGMARSAWLKDARYWVAMASLYGLGVITNWATCDNHQFLILYWCLLLASVQATSIEEREAVLASNSRLLIALCMGLAVFWRLNSDNYIDGTFFELTLLSDPRFEGFSNWFACTPVDQLAENRELVSLLKEGHQYGVPVESVSLNQSEGVRSMALAVTWWTLFIESAIAIAFVMPDNRATAAVRNFLLLVFALTTYAVAPVRGFGWILMSLGLAQSGVRDRKFRPLYVAAFALVQFYTFPALEVVQALGFAR